MHGCARLPCFAFGPLCLGNSRSNQLANTGSGQIATLCNADMANHFAVPAQQSMWIGKIRAKIKTEVHPFRVRGGEHECIARTRRKREMVGDGIHLVHEFVCFRSLFQDELTSRQRELLYRVAILPEQFEVLRIGWTHREIVSQRSAFFERKIGSWNSAWPVQSGENTCSTGD